MNDTQLIKRKFSDLSSSAFHKNIWEYSKFLNINEQSELNSSDLLSEYFLSGGYDDAERCIAVFGNEDDIGYPYILPIDYVMVTPKNNKFSDVLTHRDFLGSLMSIGLSRDMIGDILVSDSFAVVICMNTVSNYIISEIDRIKHTSVTCKLVDEIPQLLKPELFSQELIVSSERIDVIISGAYNLSRNDSQMLIKREKVFIDSKSVLSPSVIPKKGQRVSVRGYGRFVYDGVLRTTKKGRLVIDIKKN